MNKKVTISVILLFFSFLLIFPIFGTSFEEFGTDKKLTDSSGDVWRVTYTGTTYSYGYSNNYPFIDLIELTIDDSGGNYTFTIKLSADFNSSAIVGSTGSYIQIWVDANNTNYENEASSYFWVMIGSSEPSGFVYCSGGGAIPYTNDNAASISGDTVTWTFPQSEIDSRIQNILAISSWKARAWGYYAYSSEGSQGEWAVDFLADPEQDQTYQELGGGTSFGPQIPGYSITVMALISIPIIVLILRKNQLLKNS